MVGLLVGRARSIAGRDLSDARRLADVGAWEWDAARDRFRVSGELAATWPPSLAELLERVEPGDRETLCDALEAAAAGIAVAPREVTFRLRDAGGLTRTLVTRCAPARRRGRVIGATLDAGDRAEAERSRRRAARAEAMAEREHRIAQTLQRSLLPDRLPDVGVLELAARYLPGARDDEVGGDWYDVVELPSGEVALVMGDVVGRGITAAALVGKLRNALRAYALEGHEPGDVLERLNALLDRDSLEMATLLYLVFEPETGVMRWVNAGHPPPLVRRADGAREFWEGGRFVPLGALPSAGYAAATATLEPGAMILLYTDGLIERPSVPLSTTLESLRAAASRNGSAEALCDATLASLLPAGPQTDDVALLAALVTRHADGPLTLELAARVVLCANEATANAVQHAYGLQDACVWVSARRAGGGVELRVRDEGHWREPATQRRGRGIGLMRAFADEVELDHDGDGTLVTLRWGT